MRNTMHSLIAGALVLVMMTACSSEPEPPAPASNVPDVAEPAVGVGEPGVVEEAEPAMTGSITIDGSSTVGPLSEAAAEFYMEENPDVRVTVAMSGTSGGFQKFCIGENDMNDASRPIKDTEIELCGQNDIAFEAIQVANDALSLLVNRDNPLSCVTVEQANQIWNYESEVATWGDIDGLDIPAEMAAEAITLYGPGTDSGTFDFFTEVINGEEGVIRVDYIDIGEDDNMAVNAVEGDAYAMGYVPYSYYQEAGDRVRALAIDNGSGCVDATLENVQSGEYSPLGRPLFVYASDFALARPEVLDFMRFYVNNAVEIAEAAVFVPMTSAQIAEQLDKINLLIGSSGQ